MQITTNERIAASPEQVWDVLIDLDRWNEWNPHVVEAAGTAAIGNALKLTMVDPKGRKTSFKPTVVAVDQHRELRWIGKLAGIPGLFTGEHSFELVAVDGGTLLTHSETFSGLLVAPLKKMLAHLPDTFASVNRALADRVALTETTLDQSRADQPCAH